MSYQLRIDPKSRKTARFISQLQSKIQNALVASGKTQQEVADILGVDRSVVNRRLKGKANLTARSIAEFAYAFDKDIVINYVDKVQTDRVNWIAATGNVLEIQDRGEPTSIGTIDQQAKFSLESAVS